MVQAIGLELLKGKRQAVRETARWWQRSMADGEVRWARRAVRQSN